MKKTLFLATLVMMVLCNVGCNKKAEQVQEEAIVIKSDIENERTGDELTIVATIAVQPDKIQEMLPIFEAVVTGSQEEEGCISYNLYQDVADSTKFTILEEWKSQEAINFHNNTEHFKTFKEASKDRIIKLEANISKLIY